MAMPESNETFGLDTEYDRAKVPLYNGYGPPPAPGITYEKFL